MQVMQTIDCIEGLAQDTFCTWTWHQLHGCQRSKLLLKPAYSALSLWQCELELNTHGLYDTSFEWWELRSKVRLMSMETICLWSTIPRSLNLPSRRRIMLFAITSFTRRSLWMRFEWCISVPITIRLILQRRSFRQGRNVIIWSVSYFGLLQINVSPRRSKLTPPVKSRFERSLKVPLLCFWWAKLVSIIDEWIGNFWKSYTVFDLRVRQHLFWWKSQCYRKGTRRILVRSEYTHLFVIRIVRTWSITVRAHNI